MNFHYTTIRETQSWPISFFLFVLLTFAFFIGFSFLLPPGWLPDALGPFSNERSRNAASGGITKTSVRWNVTRFRTVQSSKFQVFRANPKKHGLDFWETPGGGNKIWIFVFPFSSKIWPRPQFTFLRLVIQMYHGNILAPKITSNIKAECAGGLELFHRLGRSVWSRPGPPERVGEIEVPTWGEHRRPTFVLGVGRSKGGAWAFFENSKISRNIR